MKRSNTIKLLFSLLICSIIFTNFLAIGYSTGVEIPGGLKVVHDLSSSVMPTHRSTITFTRPSTDIIHIVWYLGDPIDDTASWDVDINTRIVSNSQNFGLWNGEHSFFWIYTNVSLDDQLVLSNIWKHVLTSDGDVLYNVTGEAIHRNKEVWILEDAFGSELWYEKERGFLVNGTSKYSTNYHTYELVSAEIPGIPGYNYIILFSIITVVSIIILKKRKIKN
ncbi:MAG: hypothetical protein ACFE9S_02600 [Candidatus Hermodarchaeota archaeon]